MLSFKRMETQKRIRMLRCPVIYLSYLQQASASRQFREGLIFFAKNFCAIFFMLVILVIFASCKQNSVPEFTTTWPAEVPVTHTLTLGGNNINFLCFKSVNGAIAYFKEQGINISNYYQLEKVDPFVHDDIKNYMTSNEFTFIIYKDSNAYGGKKFFRKSGDTYYSNYAWAVYSIS